MPELTGKHLCQSLCNFIKEENLKKVFSSCKICGKFFKHLRVTASGDAEIIAGKYDIMKT